MSQSRTEKGTDKTIQLVSQNVPRPSKNGRRRNKLTAQPSVPSSAPAPSERDSYTVTALGAADRSTHAALARYTPGLSPAALAESYLDWATHLITSPGKQMQLVQKGVRKSARLVHHIGACACGRAPEPCI